MIGVVIVIFFNFLDAIIGTSKIIKRSFGAPITEADVERLNNIRIRKLQRKYVQMWKNAIIIKKARREERKFKISPCAYQLPNLYELRQEQKKKLYETNMFPNRKRRSATEWPFPSAEKRFFTSTPYRSAYQENFISTISPVMFIDSPTPSSDAENNTTF